MHLTLTPDLLNSLADQLAKDPRLAATLAEHFLANSDKLGMANYLLGGGVARRLLTERLRAKPKKTVEEVAALAAEGTTAGGRRGRPKAAEPKAAKPTAAKSRVRLSAKQTGQLKRKVVEFLKANPGSTRKQIEKSVKVPSVAVYNRVMRELKAEGTVVQKGERGKAVYGVKG